MRATPQGTPRRRDNALWTPAVRFRAVTLDARAEEIERAERFWVEGFGYRRERLSGPFVVLGNERIGWPELILQKVEDRKTAKSPVHLDIESVDLAGDAARLGALGGELLTEVNERGRRWLVLRDPAGNELCLVSPRAATSGSP